MITFHELVPATTGRVTLGALIETYQENNKPSGNNQSYYSKKKKNFVFMSLEP